MTGKAPAKASDLNDYLEGAKTKKALEDGDIGDRSQRQASCRQRHRL